jgi:hypothetical protein
MTDMTRAAGLERGYRRLLAWYPRAYRRENEQEILGVLMAGAREGQRRPGPAEAADLLRGALWMRLSPGAARPPRTVLGAVRLMLLGAVAELAGWVAYLMTARSVTTVMLQRDPAQWHAMHFHLVAVELLGLPVVVVWLFTAWANGKGYPWARGICVTFFCSLSLSLLVMVVVNGAVYAPAEFISTIVLWLIQLAVLVLLYNKKSSPYYGQEAAA